MGSLCQKHDTIIDWPCRGEQRMNSRRPTFTVIPEEDSNILSQYDKSNFTASQFYVNIESQRPFFGSEITTKSSIVFMNMATGKYLASHSIKVPSRIGYEVSLQGAEQSQVCYNEWTLCCNKETLQSGDCVDIKHNLTQRYLQAQTNGKDITIFCCNKQEQSWTIDFEQELLLDGTFIEIKHKNLNLYLQPLNKKAQIDSNKMVCLKEGGKGILWKVQLIS